MRRGRGASSAEGVRSTPCSRCSVSGDIASQRSMISRRPRVGGPRLGLLLVGHRHHPQGEDLVDLGGVEQRARALLGDLGVVVQDDRRAQHRRRRLRSAPASTGQQRCCATGGGRVPRRRRAGRAARRSERRQPAVEQHVGADQRDLRIASSLSRARRPGPGCRPHREPEQAVDAGDLVGPGGHRGLQMGALAYEPRDHLAVGLERFDVDAAGGCRRARSCAGYQVGERRADQTLDRHRLVPASSGSRRPSTSGTSTKVSLSPATLGTTALELQEA